MFDIYKTKQFYKVITEITTQTSKNQVSKLYQFGSFIRENFLQSQRYVELDTILLYNIQLNYYNVCLHTNINKFFYFLPNNTIITFNDKFIEENENEIIIYPFLYVRNNRAYYIKSSQYNVKYGDFVITVNKSKQLSQFPHKKKEWFIKISTRLQLDKNIKVSDRVIPTHQFSEYLNQVSSFVQGNIELMKLFNKIIEVIEDLEYWYIESYEIEEKTNIEQLIIDTFKVLENIKYTLTTKGTLSNKDINYVSQFLNYVWYMINLYNKHYKEVKKNLFVSVVLNREIYDVRKILNEMTQSRVFNEIFIDEELKDTIEQGIKHQIKFKRNRYLVVSNFVYELYTLFFEDLIQQYQNYKEREDIVFVLQSIVIDIIKNRKESIMNIVRNFLQGTYFVKDYKQILFLVTKFLNVSYTYDVTQTSLPTVVTTQELINVEVPKTYKPGMSFVEVDGKIYFVDTKYKNVYIYQDINFDYRMYSPFEILIHVNSK